jgi:hypothetical protein
LILFTAAWSTTPHSQNNHFPRPWKNPWQLQLLATLLERVDCDGTYK